MTDLGQHKRKYKIKYKIVEWWNPKLVLTSNYINDLNTTWGLTDLSNNSYSFLNGVSWYRTIYGNNIDITVGSRYELFLQYPSGLPAFSGTLDGINVSIQPATFSYVCGQNDNNFSPASIVDFNEGPNSIWWPNFYEKHVISNMGKNVYLYNPTLIAGYLIDLINV